MRDGFHEPNELQEFIGGVWERAWAEVAKLRRGARLVVVHCGDAIEGNHHASPQLVTNRLEEQERLHVESMRAGLKLGKYNPRVDRLYYVAGSWAHGGIGGAAEERIASQLVDLRADQTRYSYDLLKLRVNGVLFEFFHKGPKRGGRTWTRYNSPDAWLTSQYHARLEQGGEVPGVMVWGHYHKYYPCMARDHRGNVAIEGVGVPGWKVKDEYVYSMDPTGLAQVGLVVFTVHDDGVVTRRFIGAEVDRQDEVIEV